MSSHPSFVADLKTVKREGFVHPRDSVSQDRPVQSFVREWGDHTHRLLEADGHVFLICG